jgi:hypothetical protein
MDLDAGNDPDEWTVYLTSIPATPKAQHDASTRRRILGKDAVVIRQYYSHKYAFVL